MSDWKPGDPERRKGPRDYSYEMSVSLKEIATELREHVRTEEVEIATMKTAIQGDIKRLDTRINGSLNKISEFMESGKAWRVAIASIAVTVLLQVIGGIFVFGGLYKQVNINDQRLNTMEQVYRQEHYQQKGVSNAR